MESVLDLTEPMWIPDRKLFLDKLKQSVVKELERMGTFDMMEDTRQKLVVSENKVRQLESQLSQEQRVAKEKVQELEHETSRLSEELESEKFIMASVLDLIGPRRPPEFKLFSDKLKQSVVKELERLRALEPEEDPRQKLVVSENKVRQLESQLSQEQQVSSIAKEKVKELEHETSRLREELESEKAAREEAWAKVSAFELEISAAMRDLEYEKRRVKVARKRIMLRETQLRAFYSTTEEISSLFAKQQEQFKSLQKTLEEEDDDDEEVDGDGETQGNNPLNNEDKASEAADEEDDDDEEATQQDSG